MLEQHPKFICIKCGCNTWEICEYYMLHKEVWLAVNPADKGMMCIGCVETVLGRQLNPDDFMDAPINSGVFMVPRSSRLLDRLGVSQ